ncbi:Patatin-like serine hydrolase, putative [Penicillium digitatum]|nr:Patatin-like serine hydrolase, putative [Penicillium digitatum]
MLHEPEFASVCGSFAEITTVHLKPTALSDTARCEPLRALVGRELDATRSVREKQRVRPNAEQMADLFQAAFQQLLVNPSTPFDLIWATRAIYTVNPYIKPNVVYYLDACVKAGVRGPHIAPTIASAVLMDNYVPGMLMLDPRMVFRTLYRSAIVDAYHERAGYWPDRPSEDQASEVEAHLIDLFDALVQTDQTAVELRKSQLASQSGWLCRIRSNTICLYCVFQTAQHVLGCGHTLCDRCAHVFGTPTVGLEYQFTIRGCIYCLYQRPLVASILPPTMSPSVLAIDGGGVRGVIPLEFLLLIQEHLHPCRIQDVVDLALGTSSGGLIAIGLFIMTWNISTCSGIFEELARRIFRSRRRSPFALLNFTYRSGSMLGNMGRWLHWLLHDSCYDARVFDDALKSVFGENRLMFGPSRDDPRGSLQSNSKIGVVTTSISRETGAFVIGNFNTVSEPEDQGDTQILRPTDIAHEPNVWKAARATAAAPFFFTPADLQGIGSFQDGGLKHNFAGEIASQISHLIWPEAIGSTRLLSLGTGITQPDVNPTPHFRHIFRDSFIRRGFDAWMSTLGTESDWRRLKSQLDVAVRSEYHRLNVDLSGTPSTIDSVETMEDYRNLVLSQPGSSRRARDAATTLLVSRFYFELKELPQNTVAPFWCRGFVRCKGSARDLIAALNRLYPEGLTYVSGNNVVEDFNGVDELCGSCGSYIRPLSFLAHHIDHPVDLFLQASSTRRWRLSGFPERLAAFAAKQGLTSSFGRSNHGLPSRIACSSCDVASGPSRSTTQRRKRELSASTRVSKKVCFALERNT